MPLKPPEAMNPEGDWSLVLRVSRGKRERSTVVPARPPERRAAVNADRSWEAMAAIESPGTPICILWNIFTGVA